MQKRGRWKRKGRSERKEKEKEGTPYQPDSYSYSPGNDI